jgi:putative transposase
MARPLRVEFPGALYHITSRGNKKLDIFEDSEDRELFLRILGRTIRVNNWICYAYCLMNNHYHLLIETPEGNLSDGMRDLNGIYTQEYNKRHETTGHIYEGRYKSFIIESEPYLLQVARYIVLNPVRAEIASSPEEWVWSSYLGMLDSKKSKHYIDKKKILSYFKNSKTDGRNEYRKFIYEGVSAKSPFAEMPEGIILGSDQFKNEVCEISKKQEDIKEIKKSDRMIGRPSLLDLFEGIEEKEERDTAIMIARDWCGYSVTEIASHIGLSRGAVSRILNER